MPANPPRSITEIVLVALFPCVTVMLEGDSATVKPGTGAVFTVSEMLVEAFKLPEVPVIVTEVVPVAAELLAAKVTRLEPLVGLVPKEAVTPLGRPEAASVTVPLKPPAGVTERVLVALLPCATVTLVGDGARVKLPAAEVTVITKVCVLLQPFELVNVATKVFVPALNGMASISRALELNPFGPLQLQPPLNGCGPRFTVAPEAAVVVVACCQGAPFTCK